MMYSCGSSAPKTFKERRPRETSFAVGSRASVLHCVIVACVLEAVTSSLCYSCPELFELRAGSSIRPFW